jgi:hypothetical protein
MLLRMNISVSGAAFRPVYYMGKEGLSAHFPRARQGGGGPRAPVLEAYRSNSAKKDLMLSVSVCAHHSQSGTQDSLGCF